MDETLLQQMGALTEAVNTLKQEVLALRREVSELAQTRASVKFMALAIGSLVTLGAGISEMIRLFVRHA